jgi:hypothetical protein
MSRPLRLLTLCCCLLLSAATVAAEPVVLPLTLDHQLLAGLVRNAAFSGPGESVDLVGRPADCTHLSLAEPRFTSAGELLRLEIRLDIRLGSEVGGKCLFPLAWQGYLELWQRPVFAADSFQLSLQTVDSRLLTLNRQPASVAGLLWEFAKPLVYGYLDRIRLELAPPLREVKGFLAPLFHSEARHEAMAMLDSLRGGAVVVTADAVMVDLHAEVNEVYVPPPTPEQPPLSAEEREKLVQLWETWDAFLVRLLLTIAGESLSVADQDILMDVLLDTRYVFSEALAEPDLDRDFVRSQFVRVWPRLAPVFRRQLYARSGSNSLGYLAFFTAADALAVFDRMGPTLGVEISREGLLRLATMLEGQETTLPYSPEVDRRLRWLLGLPQAEPLSLHLPIPFSPRFLPRGETVAGRGWLAEVADFLVASVEAAAIPSFDEILRWKVPGDDLDGYLQRVRAVLAEATATVLDRGEIPPRLRAIFPEMVLAMAWQESCFRQFVVKNKTLTYLLSYNSTSVGLMQINERVWRGMYNREKLRWDIHYNALAGTEIADFYLRRYALREPAGGGGEPPPGLLARGVYAMYNGGPGQYEKFLARERAGALFKSDRLFAEKLAWVGAGAWEELSGCFPNI